MRQVQDKLPAIRRAAAQQQYRAGGRRTSVVPRDARVADKRPSRRWRPRGPLKRRARQDQAANDVLKTKADNPEVRPDCRLQGRARTRSARATCSRQPGGHRARRADTARRAARPHRGAAGVQGVKLDAIAVTNPGARRPRSEGDRALPARAPAVAAHRREPRRHLAAADPAHVHALVASRGPLAPPPPAARARRAAPARRRGVPGGSRMTSGWKAPTTSAEKPRRRRAFGGIFGGGTPSPATAAARTVRQAQVSSLVSRPTAPPNSATLPPCGALPRYQLGGAPAHLVSAANQALKQGDAASAKRGPGQVLARAERPLAKVSRWPNRWRGVARAAGSRRPVCAT